MTIEYNGNVFKQIHGYSDYYICKETTEILSTKQRMNTLPNTKKVLKQTPNSKDPQCNYFVVVLVDDLGVKKKHSVHRLLMETFTPNPENKAHVNHIDGNKQNNTFTNLEWATESENTQHAVDTGLMNHEHCEKVVHQYKLNGSYIASFKSDASAELFTGVAKQNISKVTLGLRPNAGGYLWSRDLKDQIEPYTGVPIPKSYTVLNLETLGTEEHFLSAPKLAALLGLPIASGSLTSRIRKHSFYVDSNYKITRNYFD